MSDRNDAMTDSSWDYLFEMAQSEEIAEQEAELSYDPGLFDEVPAEPMKLPKTPEEALQSFFGYQSFRPGQREVIAHILEGKDVLAVMPTGAGKSVCYQVPALLLPGITVVISPLISLMQDQVQALNEAGIPSAFLNSSLSEQAFFETIHRAADGQYKLLYVAPERLETPAFLELAGKMPISMVTVDEAHCISQWGQDFRPSYMKITEFVRSLEKRPILSAFTATATEIVREDIVCTLGLVQPFTLVTGFDRENLFFQVEKPKDKDLAVLKYVTEHPEESGIIYCSTRKNVDNLYVLLSNRGISAAKYHAGMNPEERKQMQEDFVYDYKKIVVATNAFGMGIDKSNVRFVIHYNMPQSMENYYQEAGRAGRDGLDAKCILLFSPQDIMIQKFLLEHKVLADMEEDVRAAIQQRDQQRLQVMERYCYTTECLRNYILKYFGENPSKPCGDCGNCLQEFETRDMTAEAKQIINCIYEARGRYGKNIIIDTVLGAKTARLEEVGAVHYKTYGVLTGRNRALLLRLIEQMLLEEYLREGNYRVLQLGDIRRLKDPDTKVLVKITDEDKIAKQPKIRKKVQGTEALTSAGYQLLDRLKALRLEIAREEHMPPYIVFSDKTLVDMAVKAPTSQAEMLQVTGVGEHKYYKYGERFTKAVEECAEEFPELLQRKAAAAEEKEATAAKKTSRNRKQEFFLLPEEAARYEYQGYRLISEITEEMNRICERAEVKKLVTTQLSEYLVAEGIIVKNPQKGSYAKDPTEKGLALGIQAEERTNQRGVEYFLLRYPEEIQRMLVERFTGDECHTN